MANRIPIQMPLAFTQGETFVTPKYFPLDENGVAFNLTAATAHLQARSAPDASSAAMDLTESTGVDIDTADNSFRINVDEAVTALVTAGTYVFDLFLQLASGRRILAMTGTLTVKHAVTTFP